MPGIAVPAEVATELQRQLNHELGAAHAYTALAIWCEYNNLKEFSKFFTRQSGEEREHALRITNHLIDRGVMPKAAAIAAPTADFPSVMAVSEHARKMEQANTQGINAAYAAALKHNDYPAQVLLHWFINEQVEEEAWADELIDRIDRANCAGGMSELDRHLERHLNGNGLGEPADED